MDGWSVWRCWHEASRGMVGDGDARRTRLGVGVAALKPSRHALLCVAARVDVDGEREG